MVTSPTKTNKSPKKSAKGKKKAVDSDDDPETDDEGRVAPSSRPLSVRQELLKKDSKVFLRRQAEKDKRERQAALSAGDPSAGEHTEPETTTKSAKKPAPKKATPAATKSTKSSTIQNGNITKPTKAKEQPQKPKRAHRPSEYNYETVSDDSEDFGAKGKTIAKLRETVNRHARWCPFVLINKKLHNVHRRTRRRKKSSDFEDGNETTEPEDGVHEDDDKDEDAAAEPEKDQSDAESDGGEGTQAAKTKQSKQTAKKPAPKKAGPKKPLPKKATASKAASAKAPTTEATSTKEVRFEDPDLNQVQDGTHGDAESEDDSGNEASEEEKSGDDEVETIAAAVEVVSDGELSELGDDEVEQLKETHESARMDLSKGVTDPLPDKDNGSLKRKSADSEVGQEEAPVAKKKRDSA